MQTPLKEALKVEDINPITQEFCHCLLRMVAIFPYGAINNYGGNKTKYLVIQNYKIMNVIIK
jgi:hypothetical protein